MRILGAILIIVLLLLGGVYFLGFTQPGNNIIKPYVESYISSKVGKKVKLTKFTLKTGHISLQAEVPQEASLIVDGDIRLFEQWFDLLYYCEAQNLQTPIMLIREKLEVKGKAVGNIDDFSAIGQGKAFGSNMDFDVHVVNKMPLDGKIDAKGINTAQVLEFLGRPRYTTGNIDVVANVKNDKGVLSGVANALIKESKLDAKLIRRDFNVALPQNTTYVGKIDGIIQGDALHIQSDIVTSLASLKTTKTNIDIKTQNLTSDFLMDIPDLKRLETFTKKRLYGKVKLYGDVKKEGKDIVVNAKSKLFKGDLTARYHKDSVEASLKNANIKDILSMLGESAYAYGKVNLDALLHNVSKSTREGKINLQVDKGEIVGSAKLKQKTGLNLPPVTAVGGVVEASIKGEDIEAKSHIQSTLANIKTQKTTINTSKESFASDFDININNLSHIGKIVQQELQGRLDLKGDAAYNNAQLNLHANTGSFGGNIDVKVDKNLLSLNVQNVLAQKLAHIVKQDRLIQGNINAQGKFSNIYSSTPSGEISYALKDGVLLGEGMEQLTSLKFPSSSSIVMDGKSQIQKGVAVFSNVLESSLGSIPKFQGTYNMAKKTLDSSYTLYIKELSKLDFITKTKLHGELKAKGVVKKSGQNLHATFDAPFLGGQTSTLFNKGVLKSQAKNISIQGVSRLLDLPYMFQSDGDFNLTYDTKSKIGKYKLFMQEGRMVQTQLSDLVLAFGGYNITQEVYKDTVLKGDINKENLSYTLDMQGQQTYINIPDGILNLTTKQTRADFDMKIQKTDLKGVIKGDISSPKISIKSSDYLKKKASKAVEKYIPKKHQDVVKGVLELFGQ